MSCFETIGVFRTPDVASCVRVSSCGYMYEGLANGMHYLLSPQPGLRRYRTLSLCVSHNIIIIIVIVIIIIIIALPSCRNRRIDTACLILRFAPFALMCSRASVVLVCAASWVLR